MTCFTAQQEDLTAMELGIDVRTVDSHSVVDVKGEIDVYTAPKLREKLIELVSEGSYEVVVNLEGVDFLDATRVEIEIPSRSVYVGVVRLALASLARSAGLSEEVVDDLKIAVSEACANAVISNEDAGSDAPVSVTWTEEPERLSVEVGDRGAVYDESSAEAVDSQGFSTRALMSFALLRSLVEESEMGPRAGGGMCARLRFRRSG